MSKINLKFKFMLIIVCLNVYQTNCLNIPAKKNLIQIVKNNYEVLSQNFLLQLIEEAENLFLKKEILLINLINAINYVLEEIDIKNNKEEFLNKIKTKIKTNFRYKYLSDRNLEEILNNLKISKNKALEFFYAKITLFLFKNFNLNEKSKNNNFENQDEFDEIENSDNSEIEKEELPLKNTRNIKYNEYTVSPKVLRKSKKFKKPKKK